MIDPHYKVPEDYRWSMHPTMRGPEPDKDKGTTALVVMLVVAALLAAQWLHKRSQADAVAAARRRRALRG